MRSCFGIPQSCRIVLPAPTRTGNCVSIRAERYAIDLPRMPGDSVQMCTYFGIPQEYRFVPTSAGECAPIWTECYIITFGAILETELCNR